MAINPFQIRDLQIPDNPRPVAVDMGSGLRSLGASYGAYREQQALADALRGATDAQGNLDERKAATALALTGHADLARQFLNTATAATAQRDLSAYHRSAAESARIAAERPDYHYQPPDLLNPGLIIEAPRRTGQQPILHPWPSGGAAPTPGPQSALPPQPGAPGAPQQAATLDPEEAPPYRVAGPPMPPPSQQPPVPAPAAAAAPAPAAQPQFNENYLRTLPTDNARALVKGVANYEIDPASLDAKLRGQVLVAAKNYRPDYNTAEYQKRGSPPSAEMAARIGLGKLFLDRLSDVADAEGKNIPGIRARIAAGEMTGTMGSKAMALVGQGGPGELRRAIDEGAEALLRGLTGAGMSATEAANYSRRYQFSPLDSPETSLRKVNELEAALRYVGTEVGKGRGGEDFTKEFHQQFGRPVETASSKAAAQALKFDDKTLQQYKGTPTAAMARAKKLLDAGADPARVRELLRQIDEGLPAKMGL